VHALLEQRQGIPAAEQRLITTSGRLMVSDAPLETYNISAGSTLHMFLPLRGGKGGFGSNLRAAGKGKQVGNFDACRDLQGRRIRHKVAAEKLEEWQAEAHERELEKLALKHLKEVEKEQRRQQQVEVDVKSIRKETEKTLDEVQDAVKFALKKRNAEEEEESDKKQVLNKRRKKVLDLGLSDSEEED
jgi:hypothetical protein